MQSGRGRSWQNATIMLDDRPERQQTRSRRHEECKVFAPCRGWSYAPGNPGYFAPQPTQRVLKCAFDGDLKDASGIAPVTVQGIEFIPGTADRLP